MIEKGAYVVFDLETGGLHEQAPILQFAAVATNENWVPVESLEIKIQVDPTRCDPKALEMNSYDQGTWDREGVADNEARMRVGRFLSYHATVVKISKRGKTYQVAQLVGHNAARFDGPRLQAWFKRAGKFLPASYLVLDTLQLAMWFQWGNRRVPKDFKLGTLYEHVFEKPIPDAHDALADVIATIALARELRL